MAQTKEGLSYSKKHLENARMAHVASRTIMFYHKANAGMGSMNLTALNMPTEYSGQSQITPEEISGARLFLYKKNLLLTSTIKGILVEGVDYAIADSQTIVLLASGYPSGATAGEIFIGRIFASPISDLIASSAKNIVKTYELPVGENILNLGHEYRVNEFPIQNVGAIKIFRNGSLIQRNTNNSSTVFDKDYYEIHAGNGYGTTVFVNNAPSTTPDKFVVDFGVMSITDHNAIGVIESLNTTVLKLATDLAEVTEKEVGEYITANPSETERRAFGDMVLSLKDRVDELEQFVDTMDENSGGGGGGGPVTSQVVDSMAGNEQDMAPSVASVKTYTGQFAPKISPAFTGSPTAPTQATSDNSTKIATTAFVTSKVSVLAPLASPAFTGTPTAPTPTAGDNTTKVATTAFVKNAIDSMPAPAVPDGTALAISSASININPSSDKVVMFFGNTSGGGGSATYTLTGSVGTMNNGIPSAVRHIYLVFSNIAESGNSTITINGTTSNHVSNTFVLPPLKTAVVELLCYAHYKRLLKVSIQV